MGFAVKENETELEQKQVQVKMEREADIPRNMDLGCQRATKQISTK